MKSKVAMSALLLSTILMISGPMLAHHGNTSYAQTPVTKTGTVTEFVWANPHCQIYLDAKDDQGNVVHWSVELNNPGVLARAGWHKTSLKPGDEVTVTMQAAKNGDPVGSAGTRVKFADGKPIGTPTPADPQQ